MKYADESRPSMSPTIRTRAGLSRAVRQGSCQIEQGSISCSPAHCSCKRLKSSKSV